MNSTKLDPDLNSLFVLNDDELRLFAEQEQLGIRYEDDTAHVVVTVRCKGEIDNLDGVSINNKKNLRLTLTCTLDGLAELSEQENVIYISATHSARSDMHRTREQIGANITDGKRIRNGTANWDGTGTFVGILDSGIDLRHPSFRQFPGGPTRVEFFWDRVVTARSTDTADPSGVGVVYTRAQIDGYLNGSTTTSVQDISEDFGRHGTHVASIAAGSTQTYKGIAPGASLIVVRTRGNDLSQADDLCEWIFNKAAGRPCSINISQGITSGPRDGTSDVEAGLDELLRDPTSLAAHPGRFICKSAGNERARFFNAQTRVLPQGHAVTQLIWRSPNANTTLDGMEFWYSGLDRVGIRMISPLTSGDRITYWVDPDPAGCIERASPGGFAPVTAGAAGSKRFNFTGGAFATISQGVNAFNGDRSIVVRLNPNGDDHPIPSGNWLIELQGLNTMPGSGTVHSMVRKSDNSVSADSRFVQVKDSARSIVVQPNTELQLDLYVSSIRPRTGAPSGELDIFIEYSANQDLQAQIEPVFFNGNPVSEWVGHGPTAVALVGATAAGTATPDGLPFQFPDGFGVNQTATINHVTIGQRKQIRIYLQQRVNPPAANEPPESGIYHIRLRSTNTDRPVKAEVRLQQDRTAAEDYCYLMDNRWDRLTVPIYPDPAVPAVGRLVIIDREIDQTIIDATIPSGYQVHFRIVIPPANTWQESGGWTFTPWIAQGNVEVATPGALAVNGTPARGDARTYITNNNDIRIDYSAPSEAGRDGNIYIELNSSGAPHHLNFGVWRLEYKGLGVTTPLTINHIIERVVEDSISPENFDSFEHNHCLRYFTETGRQPIHIPFSIPRHTNDEITLEILYDIQNEVQVRIDPPAPHQLAYAVGLNNTLYSDPGAVAPSVGVHGVTGTLSGGTAVTCNVLSSHIYAGSRRVIITIRGPATSTIFHPTGYWNVQIIPISTTGDKKLVARLHSQGHAAHFPVQYPNSIESGYSTLSAPGTARELMTVANTIPALSPTTFTNGSSSAGPARKASRMQLNGINRRWLNYAKPEISAPGTDIIAACSSTGLWVNPDQPLGWATYQIPQGQVRGMRASWPLLSNRDRIHTQNVNPAAAAGTLISTNWTFTIPRNANRSIEFEIRYPVGRNFAVRVEQPSGATAPNRTHAVRPPPHAVEWAVAGAGVAAGQDAPNHPDGRGRFYRMNDGNVVFIRHNSNGIATISIWPNGVLATGDWQITLQHEEVFPTAAPVTLETKPPLDILGWPKFSRTLQIPRVTGSLSAVAPGTPSIIGVPLTIPHRMTGDVSVRIRYAAPPAGPGAYVFILTVLSPIVSGTPPTRNHTDGINTNSGTFTIPNTPSGSAIMSSRVTSSSAVANGRQFNFPNGTRVTIVHTPGSATVTFHDDTSTGGSTRSIAAGEWSVGLLNNSSATPAAPVAVTIDLDPGPHDAPLFLLPDGAVPYAFRRAGNLATGAVQNWDFLVPQGRHQELQLELIYDSRDSIEIQLNVPGGARTAPVRMGNIAPTGVAGVTIENSTSASAPAPREFVDANHFRVIVDHRVHSQSTSRNRVLVTIRAESLNPIPTGTWQLLINPLRVHASSHGMAEAFMVEMLFQSLTGTSMSCPHIAGLAALMMQQDTTQTHADIKRRMLETVKPNIITHGNSTQLPNQWNPLTGWGSVDAEAALLGHRGGPLHQQGQLPAAVGKTTSSPVSSEDNFLVEGVFNPGLMALSHSPRAPYNLSPSAPDQRPLLDSPRLRNYLGRYHQNPFTGGENASLRALTHTTIQQPLVRDRTHRGTLAQFATSSWDEIYTTLAERFVDQWSSTGTVVVLEDKPESGLVREILFNRFVHHLHRLLTASNQVTKCSFTTKRSVDVLGSRVPYGSPFSGASFKALKELFNDQHTSLLGRCDLSMANNIVVWGANLPANAQALWRQISSLRTVRGEELQVFVIDPGLQDVPDYARRICLQPGSDRHLAMALMLKVVGNTGHADSTRQIPEDARFSDAGLGIQAFLTDEIANLNDFIDHIRSTAAECLRLTPPNNLVQIDTALSDRVLNNATPADITRLQQDFDALYDAYLGGSTTTLLGGSLGRYIDGEENIQYIAALALLTGNLGNPGAGISLGEDLHQQFNNESFATSHDSLRPELNTAQLGEVSNQETLNLASLKADAPSNTKIMLWFGLDPLTHFPDADNIQELLGTGGTQLNIQITSSLDDSSRYADIILPITDTIQSFDLQFSKRSPWINLTQPIKPLQDAQARPIARVLHETFQAIYRKLKDDFNDDLAPVIEEPLYATGALLLSRTRRQWFNEFFTSNSRIPDLLVDRLPRDEAVNIHTQLRDWYAAVHVGEPTTDTEESVAVTNWLKFFDRMQVDWILEVLFARYREREVVFLLYNLLVSGTALDPHRFGDNKLNILPDGCTPWSNQVAMGTTFADLKGSDGFAPENANYRISVLAQDSATRSSFPMRLILSQSPDFSSTLIPLSQQLQSGNPKKPDIYINQNSQSVSGLGLNTGDIVKLVGNLAYTAGETYAREIAEATVHFDPHMAKDTIWMGYGWNSFNRGGQRLIRGIHSEEGENPALFDNLVRIQAASSAVPASADGRGDAPAKR